MPDIIVHRSFGAEVLKRTGIDVERDIYDFGLLGPDPYLFYHFYVPPFRNLVNHYSYVMHRRHTGDFLVALAYHARESHEVYSYLAGFLCHYALDATTHPYINRMSNNRYIMHMAIEHKLDNMDGGEPHIPPFLPESLKEPVGGTITKIYGWKDAWDKFKKGHRDMTPFHKLVEDQNGTLDRFASKTHTKLNLVSYRSKALDDMDLSGFYPLYRRALNVAEKYVNAATAFVNGEIDEAALREVIGSRSYIDG